MNLSLSLAIFFAILSPILFAFMNTLDKFVISKRVKHTLGFVPLTGVANLTFGLVLALFLDWSAIQASDVFLTAISGIAFGSQFYLYYAIMKKGDASNFVSLIYFYPVITALLSFSILHERLPAIAYLGIILSVIGASLMSFRIKKLDGTKILFMILLIIGITAVYEFTIKLITNNISEWNGIALEFIFIGLTILVGLFSRKIRYETVKEIKNFKWAFLTEVFTLMAVTTTFLAMTKLSPTTVAVIATIQPIVVLIFEKAMIRTFGKIYKDKITFWRVLSMLLTLIGVVIVTMLTN